MTKWPDLTVNNYQNCHKNVKTYESTKSGRATDVNLNFHCSVSGIYGNRLSVFPVGETGDMADKIVYIHAHSEVINDIEWSPTDDNMMASASDDNLVKFWKISGKSSLGNNDYIGMIQPSKKAVTELQWNPRVEGLILCAARDSTTSLWDVEALRNMKTIKVSEERISSTTWNQSGSYFATASLDSHINVFDPRKSVKNVMSISTEASQYFRILFLSQDNLISQVGYSRHYDRRMTLWDIRMPTKPWKDLYIDSQHGLLLPFFDPQNQIMYIFSKGSSIMRSFNLIDFSYRSLSFSTDHCSVASMPNWGLQPDESMRFYRNVISKSQIEQISFGLGQSKTKPPLETISLNQWVENEKVPKNGHKNNEMPEHFTQSMVEQLKLELETQKSHYEHLLSKKEAEIVNLQIELDRLHNAIYSIYDQL